MTDFTKIPMELHIECKKLYMAYGSNFPIQWDNLYILYEGCEIEKYSHASDEESWKCYLNNNMMEHNIELDGADNVFATNLTKEYIDFLATI